MALITCKIPLEQIYVDLIKQIVKIVIIFILYMSLEKTNEIKVYKLILYIILGMMFNKLVVEEIIDIV